MWINTSLIFRFSHYKGEERNRDRNRDRGDSGRADSDWRSGPRTAFAPQRSDFPPRNGLGNDSRSEFRSHAPYDFEPVSRRGFNDADKTFGGPRRGDSDYDRPRRAFGTGFGSDRDDYPSRGSNDYDELAQRPKLNLLPRSTPRESEDFSRERDAPRERQPLKLAPRTKPIEPLDIPQERPLRSEVRDDHTPPIRETGRDSPREPIREPLREPPREVGRHSPRENDREEPPQPEPPKERPRLKLQPRTKPKDANNEPVATSAIFGGAKPVDTLKRELEIEERLRKQSSEAAAPETEENRVRKISTNSSAAGSARGSRRSSDSERPSLREGSEPEKTRRPIDFDRGYDGE